MGTAHSLPAAPAGTTRQVSPTRAAVPYPLRFAEGLAVEAEATDGVLWTWRGRTNQSAQRYIAPLEVPDGQIEDYSQLRCDGLDPETALLATLEA